MSHLRKYLGLLTLGATLSGCWEAATPLMPVSAKDTPSISGTFDRLPKGKNGSIRINAASTKQFQLIETKVDGSRSTSLMSIDQLELPSEPRSIAAEGPIYILESQAGPNMKEVNYSLLFSFVQDGEVSQLIHVEPACSKAAMRIIGDANNADKKCIFKSYDQVRAAALDAMDWLEDARIQVNGDIYLKRE
jgi:hypothetical protein